MSGTGTQDLDFEDKELAAAEAEYLAAQGGNTSNEIPDEQPEAAIETAEPVEDAPAETPETEHAQEPAPVIDFDSDANPYKSRHREASATITRTSQENAELKRELASMAQRLAEIQAEKPKSAQAEADRKEEISDLLERAKAFVGGDENDAKELLGIFDELYTRKAQAAVETVLAPIKGTLEQQRIAQAQDAKARYERELFDSKTGIPDAYERSSDPTFQAALESIVPGGMDLLRHHHSSGNAQGVIKLFKLVDELNSKSATADEATKKAQEEAARNKIAGQTMPTAKSTPPVTGKKVYTQSQTDALLKKAEDIDTPESESKAIFNEVLLAQREGRIRG